MTNVLDYISKPVESSGSTITSPKLSVGIPSLLSDPIGGTMSQSTPQFTAPGTPNIDPVSIFNSILPGVKPIVQSVRQRSFTPLKEEFARRAKEQDTGLYTIDGKKVGIDYEKVLKNASDLVLGTAGPAGGISGEIRAIARSTNPEEIAVILSRMGADESIIPQASRMFSRMKNPEEISTLMNSTFKSAVPKLESKITDPHDVQEIKNSIAEGEGILRTGKSSVGRKLSPEELQRVQRSVDNAKSRIGITQTTKLGKSVQISNFLSKPVEEVVRPTITAPKTAPEASRMSGQVEVPVSSSIADRIAVLKDPVEISKVLETTGVDKAQIPQMSRVLAGINSPKKVNNIIEGFDTTRAPRKAVEYSPEIQQKEQALELKKETLQNSPFNNKNNRIMVDREGRILELGDVKHPDLIRKIEDQMAESGITDPADFAQGIENFFKQKKEFQIKEVQQLPDEIAKTDNFQNIEQYLMSSKEGKTVLDRELETIRSLPAKIRKEIEPLSTIIKREPIDVKKKVGLLDYLRTPEKVLQKIGAGKLAKQLSAAHDSYVAELPKHIEQITEWSKKISPDRKATVFDWLDGKQVSLKPNEVEVAKEIEGYLSDWADRLGLPDDNRISSYITHIFEQDFIKKEFDENLANIIADKIPGQVYDPFLEKRLGKLGFIRDPWRALDAYVKRAVRKVNMDPVLKVVKNHFPAEGTEQSQFNYIKRYLDRINLRPTEIDNLIDNQFKQIFGYRFGGRPVANIMRKLRQVVYRGGLGANIGSAFRNLSQGVNTYSILGEKYTTLGYASLMKNGTKELEQYDIFMDNFIEDRVLSSTRQLLQKADKGLMTFFDTAEKINRGSAFYGAKLKAINEGKTEEQAIEYAKDIVKQTQFKFSPIDTPVALQGDLIKVLTQFMTYNIKQTEFLVELAKTKSWGSLLRYLIGSIVVISTIGKLYGSTYKDFIPTNRFTDDGGLTAPIPKAGIDFLRLFTGSKDRYGQPEDTKERMNNLLKDMLVFVPGGTQAKKTYQGIKAVSEGKDVTAGGKTRFTIPQTPTNYTRAGLFGKNILPQAQEYFDKRSAPKKEVAPSGGTKLPALPKLPSLKGSKMPGIDTSLPSLPKLPKLSKPVSQADSEDNPSILRSLFGVQTASAAEFPPGYRPELATTSDGVQLRTVPSMWKQNIKDAYDSRPALKKFPGLIEAILMQESSMGTIDRNYNPKIGESAWLGGVTDIMKKELDRKGIEYETDTPKGVVNAVADYLVLKSTVTNPGQKTAIGYKDPVNLYLQRYKTSSGIKLTPAQVKRFRSYINYYKNQ